jgi:hypothetical protein
LIEWVEFHPLSLLGPQLKPVDVPYYTELNEVLSPGRRNRTTSYTFAVSPRADSQSSQSTWWELLFGGGNPTAEAQCTDFQPVSCPPGGRVTVLEKCDQSACVE